jgi:hypothetical protein
MPISGKLTKSLGISTLTGGDGKLYIFRVRDMKKYLSNALGVSPLRITSGFENAFPARRGLVSFDVGGWSDASGHVALWDGLDFREAHDDYRSLKDDPSTPQKEAAVQAMTLWEI